MGGCELQRDMPFACHLICIRFFYLPRRHFALASHGREDVSTSTYARTFSIYTLHLNLQARYHKYTSISRCLALPCYAQ
jgi:hypothetical protein